MRDRRTPDVVTTALDTSVVVASLLAWHEHHARALTALERAMARGDVLLTFDVRDYERLEPGGLRVESP